MSCTILVPIDLLPKGCLDCREKIFNGNMSRIAILNMLEQHVKPKDASIEGLFRSWGIVTDPNSTHVEKASSDEDIVHVAGKATAKYNRISKRETNTGAKSSSSRRTGGRKEVFQPQQSRREGICWQGDGRGNGERMGRGYRTDKVLDAGKRPPTKRRRDDDVDEEGSASRVGKRMRTH